MASANGAIDDYPVLIAGGGLIGLSTAMFLAQHGISSLAVERLQAGSQLPRAAFFHTDRAANTPRTPSAPPAEDLRQLAQTAVRC